MTGGLEGGGGEGGTGGQRAAAFMRRLHAFATGAAAEPGWYPTRIFRRQQETLTRVFPWVFLAAALLCCCSLLRSAVSRRVHMFSSLFHPNIVAP